ncbi:ABC-F family ATP-binding cassette domain-containing protein [Salidesulfovibrio brasiliensis]|uniref:ABC-F family ATP-binding cassette domain-containing protein n=1 Tax=Salidesulfovibrio brasiliensis TaxID=221711 RepID=UPI0006D18552|nr:ABC-F family ATP-binding cassette domain-containing protein [Salidesulfovibrio brasiliensis]
MSRITVSSLEIHYGGEEVFSDVSFEVGPGMRLAATGPNGCGKSTLLRILAGVVEHDGGQLSIDRGAQIGYVAQELSGKDLEKNLLAWVMDALPSWSGFWEKWEKAVADGDDARIAELSHVQAEFEEKYGYSPEHKARAILSGLGFSDDDLFKRILELSGGWRERAKLARVLLQGADILLLDEPTNHLDLEAVEWLEQYLLNFRGALVFVAHDRVFLNKVATHVLFLGDRRSVMRKGNFDDFLVWQEEDARQRAKEVEKLSARIEHEQNYIDRFRVKARKAAQAQSKIKKVEKMAEELDRLKKTSDAARTGKRLSFRLPQPQRGDKVAIAAVDLRFSYDKGPSVWDGLDFQLYRGQKVALMAPNGAGKTTLLKLITGSLKPHTGHTKIGNKTKVGYFSQHQHEILNLDGTALSEIRRLSDPNLTEEQLMNVLGLFLLGEDFFERKVADLSGGEKSRLLLATLFLSHPNMLILDEPTNHLDIESREGLISALKDYEGTLLFVAHDRYLLSEVAEEVWELSGNGIEQYLGGFADYQEKRLARLAEARDGKSREKPVEKRRLTKEEKRRQAEERNRLYRQLKPLRKEYEKLEVELEKAMEDQAQLEEALNDPATYEKPEQAMKFQSEYNDVNDWVDSLMEKMGTLEAEITELESRAGGGED